MLLNRTDETVNTSQTPQDLYLCSSQVAAGSGMSSGVASKWAVVFRYVEPQAEEEVVPDEHMHMRRLAWV